MKREETLEKPLYTCSEAAGYIHIPASTLRSWIAGASYRTQKGPIRSKGIIPLPDADRPQLSFMNLIEAHVLAAIRRKYKVSLQAVRSALRNLQKISRSGHPLAEEDFRTDGIGLFVERYGSYVSLAKNMQMEMKDLISTYLQRIDYDVTHRIPVRLYPFTRTGGNAIPSGNPRIVMIDPFIAFGRPTLTGTGIKTSIIVDRFLAGDQPQAIAEDYCRPIEEINEAIRWEIALGRAA